MITETNVMLASFQDKVMTGEAHAPFNIDVSSTSTKGEREEGSCRGFFACDFFCEVECKKSRLK